MKDKQKSRGKHRSKLPGGAGASLRAWVKSSFNIDDWHMAIVGDGSGCGWTMAMGWGAIVVDERYHYQKLLYGAHNRGTVSAAELMPTLHGLMWYDAEFGAANKRVNRSPTKVLVLSDSKYIVDTGNAMFNPESASTLIDKYVANQPLLATLIQFAGKYLVSFRWVGRDRMPLHIFADTISARARRAMVIEEGIHNSDKSRILLAEDINAQI